MADADPRAVQVAGERHQAVERRLELPATPLAELLGDGAGREFEFAGDRTVRGRVRMRATEVAEPRATLVRACLHNTTELDAGEAGMLAGVFHLHEQEARQVMTPIPAVVTCDVSETAEAALRRCVESGHTRLVVTEDDNTDRIKGLVHANSLARVLMEQGPEATIAGLVRDAPIVAPYVAFMRARRSTASYAEPWLCASCSTTSSMSRSPPSAWAISRASP